MPVESAQAERKIRRALLLRNGRFELLVLARETWLDEWKRKMVSGGGTEANPISFPHPACSTSGNHVSHVMSPAQQVTWIACRPRSGLACGSDVRSCDLPFSSHRPPSPSQTTTTTRSARPAKLYLLLCLQLYTHDPAAPTSRHCSSFVPLLTILPIPYARLLDLDPSEQARSTKHTRPLAHARARPKDAAVVLLRAKQPSPSTPSRLSILAAVPVRALSCSRTSRVICNRPQPTPPLRRSCLASFRTSSRHSTYRLGASRLPSLPILLACTTSTRFCNLGRSQCQAGTVTSTASGWVVWSSSACRAKKLASLTSCRGDPREGAGRRDRGN